MAIWTAWSMFATFAGAPAAAGPILGLAAGLLFAVDPLDRIWSQSASDTPVADAPGIAELA